MSPPRRNFPFRHSRGAPPQRVNGRIRAREVRVVDNDGSQLGVLALGEAISMARAQGVDLVEVAPNANPPVCRLVDYGKWRYEQAKKTKESKKHHHSNKVKEIQLSASIDSHDFTTKTAHAIDFLCEDMKVKASLRFRGRENAHREYGFQVVEKFIEALAPYGQPDAAPRLIGRSINLMLSPLPRNKRAKSPRQEAGGDEASAEQGAEDSPGPNTLSGTPETTRPNSGGFTQSPFANLDGSLENR